MRRRTDRRMDWDLPALIVSVVSGACAAVAAEVGMDRWVGRAARVSSLAQAIQSSHDKGRMEEVAILGMVLAFAVTSAIARRRRLLWGLVPLGVMIIVSAVVDARINHESNWTDDLTNAPVTAVVWLLSSGLVATVRAAIDHFRAPRGWPPPDVPLDQTRTWPPPPAP